MPRYRNTSAITIDDLPGGKMLGPQEDIEVDPRDVESLAAHLERGHLVPVTMPDERPVAANATAAPAER